MLATPLKMLIVPAALAPQFDSIAHANQGHFSVQTR